MLHRNMSMKPEQKAELLEKLTEQERYVTQEGGTDGAYTGEYTYHFARGCYRCKVCDSVLFRSDDKYDSGTGWPSYRRCEEGSVVEVVDVSYDVHRVEVRCSTCDAHLGHVFRSNTSVRYCINSSSLSFNHVN